MIWYEVKVKEAEAHLSDDSPSTQPPAQPPPPPAASQPAPKPSLATFRPNQDLKPSMLKKECNYQECMHFIDLWKNYIIAGCGSEDNIPQETLSIQLQPFVNPTWWAQLLEMGIKQKTFKQIPETIKEVAGRFITVFDRRVEFLKTKRGNMSHSDFLHLLEGKID